MQFFVKSSLYTLEHIEPGRTTAVWVEVDKKRNERNWHEEDASWRVVVVRRRA